MARPFISVGLERIVLGMQFGRSRILNRSWLDFRNGHNTYLAFILTFANFVLLFYNLAVVRLSFGKELFSSPIIFAVFFIAAYVPTAMILGYLHRRRQMVAENEINAQENWVHAWQFLYLIRLTRGIATQEETDRVFKYLDDVLKRHHKDHLIIE